MKNSKVQTTMIGNKKIIFDPSYGGYEKLNKKWGIVEGDSLGESFRDDFCLDAIWTAIKPGIIFKPYITKKRMRKKMKPWDMKRIVLMVEYVYGGKFFTEDELTAEIKKRDEDIKREVEKVREKIKNMSLDEAAEYFDKQSDEAIEGVKKNT